MKQKGQETHQRSTALQNSERTMEKTNIHLLESFIETIESSHQSREHWLKKVSKLGLEETLGEYNVVQQNDQSKASNDHLQRYQ